MKRWKLFCGAALLSVCNAQAAVLTPSDRLIVSDHGITVFDQTIAEANPENPLIFGSPLTFPDDLVLATHVVIVVEPVADADLGADPILIPNPGDPRHSFVLSDVITRLGHLGQPDFRILFGSDGDPFLRPGFNFLQQSGLPLVINIIAETGGLQDVTELLNLGGSGLSVKFQSDAVPLPASVWLLSPVLGGFGLIRRSAKRRNLM